MNGAQLFYTLAEVAAILRRSQKGVRRLVADGLLRRDRTSYRILIPRTDVDGFADRRDARLPAKC